jgi:cytochrome c-type biogenesis protein CcmH/NrfG
VKRCFLLVLFFVSWALYAASPSLERANRLYQYTDYEGSLQILLPIQDKDGAIYTLIGKNYYMLGDFKKATESLGKAVKAQTSNSEYHLWLGRAYGRRAETSSVFTAPGLASKARENFERAVSLDPKNLEAINDLFEYYLAAPGFLGGGYEKAAKLAARIAQLDPVEGHYAQAKLAEDRKEYSSAEAQLRRAAELAPQQVGRVIDLAKFLARQGRFQESDQSFERAERIAPNSPKLLYQRAETYISDKRNLDIARMLLRQYLASKLTPDDPPRSEAEKLLKQIGG